MWNPTHHSPSVAEVAAIQHVRGLIAQATQHDGGPSTPLVLTTQRRLPQWPDETLRQLSIAEREQGGLCFVPERDWSKVAILTSRQTTLRLLCKEINRPPPVFKSQLRELTHRGLVQRFLISVPPGPDTPEMTAAGRYSTDQHLAREDAAAAMITKLLNLHGKHIDDYNHDLQDEATMVIERLQQELDSLRSRYERMRSAYKHHRRLLQHEFPSDSETDAV